MVFPLRLAGALLAFSAGCGLIDSDIARFDLSLPERELTIDAAQWGLPEAESLPAIECEERADRCAEGLSDFCAPEADCQLSCRAASCELALEVNIWQTFDLAEEKPELRDLGGQKLVRVEVETIAYSVTENTLSSASPILYVYIAPEGVVDSRDSRARLIGQIPPVPAATLVERGEMELSDEGRSILGETLGNYTIPFHLIVAGDVALAAGDPLPAGKLVASILVEASAGL